MSPESKASVATIVTVVSMIPVGFLAFVGLLASGETKEWDVEWADRMVLIGWIATVAWTASLVLTIWLWLRVIQSRKQ